MWGHKEYWALKNWCFQTVVLEKSLKSPLDCKEIKPVNTKGNQPWMFIGRTDAEASSNTLAIWCEELTHWKRPWFWERLKAKGEGDDRGWDGCMASLTQWTWIWANSGRQWRTEEAGMLQSTGSQRVGHDLATEQHLWNAVLGCNLKNDRMISVHFQGKPFKYHSNPILCPKQ